MPRLTPLRVLRFLSLPWIVLVGLWLTLPSPSIPAHERTAYIKDRLARGKTVITAIDNYQDLESCSFACSTLLPHWKLVLSDSTTTLHLSSWEEERGSINITKYIQNAEDWNSKHILWPQNEWVPFFSHDPLVLHDIPVGDTDEEVNMPWFHITDKKLFEYEMHNTDADIKVHVIIPKPDVVEIWRASYVDENWQVAINEPRPKGTGMRSEKLAYEHMLYNENTNDILATLKIVQKWNAKDEVTITGLAGRLPSRTFWIRKKILFLLAPFLLVISYPLYFFAYPIIEAMGPFFPFVAIWMSCLVALVVYRRMLEHGPISSYFGRFLKPWNTVKRLVGGIFLGYREERSIWGPAGPVAVQTHNKWFDEEKNIGLKPSHSR